jgi:ABC-2 type transport system permease protein
VLVGLYFPLRFLPDWLVIALWLGTPFPSLLQAPLDVLVERDPAARQAAVVALQAAWAGILLAACVAVQRRAERRLVVQGG